MTKEQAYEEELTVRMRNALREKCPPLGRVTYYKKCGHMYCEHKFSNRNAIQAAKTAAELEERPAAGPCAVCRFFYLGKPRHVDFVFHFLDPVLDKLKEAIVDLTPENEAFANYKKSLLKKQEVELYHKIIHKLHMPTLAQFVPEDKSPLSSSSLKQVRFALSEIEENESSE